MLRAVITGGLLIDGSGAPARRSDVAIQGDRIAAVDRLEAAQAETVADASGCVVCPGFVDMHSHTDFTLPVLPTADSLVHQGITTAVVGQCGSTPVPLLPDTREHSIAMMQSDEYELPWQEWSTFGSYLDYLRKIGTSINVVPLVGQGTLRQAVMGFTAAAPSEEQIARMQAEVVEALDERAVGISTGLIYPPGSYATTEELIAVTRPVGERGGLYFSHIRGEGQTLLEAISEAIRIGRETGAAIEISHLKASGRAHWDKAARALEMIEAAQAEGLDVTADMYPYLAGSRSLVSSLPHWAQEGGKEAILARLADAETRKGMAEGMRDEWDKVLIASSPRNRAHEGRYVADMATAAGKQPTEWVFDALLETELRMQQIAFGMSEDNVRMQLQRPWVMIGTDASGRAPEGPLSRGLPHPRSYGTFPRILGHYVREEKLITLEEAIHRMTGLPARKLHWPDRGLTRPGYKADLVVFDPQTVADRATYEKPHRYAVGIRHVIVNGAFVIRDGEHTGERPGRVLGRS